MKKVNVAGMLLLVACIAIMSCKKNDANASNGGNFGNGPRSQVPDALVGYWLQGSSSIGNFWNYDGSYSGAGYELALGYRFYKNGDAKQYFYYTSTSYYCRTQVLGYKEGTVKFDEAAQTFTFYPASGTYRGYNSCGSAQSPGFGETKKYGSDELYPAKSSNYSNYSLIKMNGKDVIRVPYSDGSNGDFEKTTEPDK